MNKLTRDGLFRLLLPGSLIVVGLFYADIFKIRQKLKVKRSLWLERLYWCYLDVYGAWIGIDAEIDEGLVLPHGLNGIHISNEARIGKDCVIFQHVTIGSNKSAGSERYGSPIIGNNVMLGVGSAVIGHVTIGDHVRIGAGTTVVKDIQENVTVVSGTVRMMKRDR